MPLRVTYRQVFRAACGFATAVLCASTVHAATSATLIGPDLDPREASVQSIREGKISYFDEYRALQVKPLADFIQIRELGARDRARQVADTPAVTIMELGAPTAERAEGPLAAPAGEAAPLMVPR